MEIYIKEWMKSRKQWETWESLQYNLGKIHWYNEKNRKQLKYMNTLNMHKKPSSYWY